MGDQNDIAELYAIRMGSLALLSCDDANTTDAEQYRERVKKVLADINKRVRESPIVTAEPRSQLSKDEWALFQVPKEGQARWAVQCDSPLRINVHWPRKNQELLFLADYSGPVVEDFDLTWDGFTFVAAARCAEPIPAAYSFLFGREGRRILTGLVEEPTAYDLEVFGPSPIRPIVYLAVVGGEPELPLGRELLREANVIESVYVMRPENFEALGSDVGVLADSLLFPMRALGRTLALRSEFAHQLSELDSAFCECGPAYSSLCSGFPLHPRGWWNRAFEGRRLRRAIGTCYSRYVEAEEARASMREALLWLDEQFSRHPLLQPHKDWGAETVEDAFRWSGSHVLEALRFFGEECRSRGIEAATWRGPLVGALIALAATALALWLGG